jgi:hypothetical protein
MTLTGSQYDKFSDLARVSAGLAPPGVITKRDFVSKFV